MIINNVKHERAIKCCNFVHSKCDFNDYKSSKKKTCSMTDLHMF